MFNIILKVNREETKEGIGEIVLNAITVTVRDILRSVINHMAQLGTF